MKALYECDLLICLRTSAVVERGIKAMGLVYKMTSRVPHFIEQSHLETTEGMSLSRQYVP